VKKNVKKVSMSDETSAATPVEGRYVSVANLIEEMMIAVKITVSKL
jgi:hypothetical protein